MEGDFYASRYNNLRENVSVELAGLSDQELAETLAERNIDAEAMEGFLSDVGKFAKKALPSVLPIAGRVLGGVVGGPAGAAIGGQLGSFAGGAVASAGGRRSRPGARRVPVMPVPIPVATPPAPAMTVAPGVAPPAVSPDPGEPEPAPIAAGAGSPAASQLLQAITRPEVLQALASMAMGDAGRSDVAVNGTAVPVNAFSNLLGVLAGQAEAEYSESMARSASALPAYMIGNSGEALGDPAIEEDRARSLFELLSEQESSGEWESESESEFESESESEWAEFEADEAELLELEYELAEEN